MKHRATQRRPERRASASPPFRRSRRAGTRLFWGAPVRVARLGATQIKTIFVCGPESEKGAKPTRRPLPPLRVALCSNHAPHEDNETTGFSDSPIPGFSPMTPTSHL